MHILIHIHISLYVMIQLIPRDNINWKPYILIGWISWWFINYEALTILEAIMLAIMCLVLTSDHLFVLIVSLLGGYVLRISHSKTIKSISHENKTVGMSVLPPILPVEVSHDLAAWAHQISTSKNYYNLRGGRGEVDE